MNTPTAKQIRPARETVARQFEQEMIRLGFTIERVLPNYRFVLQDRVEKKTHRAIVLPCSFDYYEYRLNVGKRRVDMLIVARHNAVVPVEVICLETVTKYAALDSPNLVRTDGKRRSTEEANLLLSKYILNFESAHEEIAKMTTRTRIRYDQRREMYLKARRGRPWAS